MHPELFPAHAGVMRCLAQPFLLARSLVAPEAPSAARECFRQISAVRDGRHPFLFSAFFQLPRFLVGGSTHRGERTSALRLPAAPFPRRWFHPPGRTNVSSSSSSGPASSSVVSPTGEKADVSSSSSRGPASSSEYTPSGEKAGASSSPSSGSAHSSGLKSAIVSDAFTGASGSSSNGSASSSAGSPAPPWRRTTRPTSPRRSSSFRTSATRCRSSRRKAAPHWASTSMALSTWTSATRRSCASASLDSPTC